MDTVISRRALMLAAGTAIAWQTAPLRALSLAANDRDDAAIDGLIARMTLEEKAGQLTLMAAAWGGSAAATLNPASQNAGFAAQLAEVKAGRLTGVFNGNGAEMARRMQIAATRYSRLKVPLLFAADVIHGYRTIFPVPLGEAASFEPALAQRTARAAAVEAAAAGIDWTFAPMVDIARDARWGRGVEGAGEDVLLGEQMAAARVRGFQGSSGLAAPDAIMACAKHFAAYGAAEAGLDYNSVDVSERTLRQVYFPPFEAALVAGCRSVMAAFNEISGVPATANEWLLIEVLRREWRFNGITVSDYTADEELIAHGYAADARAATRLAFMAGVDISMQSGFYRDHLPALVRGGEVPVARVDAAVRRVLSVKAALGLFDDPFRRIDPAREKVRIRMPAALALAREAGRKSIVMLRNEDELLPLPRAGKRIALIGPFAEGTHDLIGPWNVYGTDADAVDLATGVRSGLVDPSMVTASPGSGIEAPLPGGIDAAVTAATHADIVVLAIGESQQMSGEAQSRSAVVVPPAQQALAEAVAATGKPMVVLLKNGRALALTGAVLDAPAILVTWFLGSETGHAIADILFGAESPSARLPVSFPYATGQEPYYYAHKSTGRPNPPGPIVPYKANYRDIPNAALFPFGHGLNYGRMKYSELTLSADILDRDGELRAGATIANEGRRTAEEVAQLYIHDVAASITRPVRQLKAYRKVSIAPGRSVRVEFVIRCSDLSFIGPDLKPRAEPGLFRLFIAPSAEAAGISGHFTLKA